MSTAAFNSVELAGNHGFGGMSIDDQIDAVTISGSSIHDNHADLPVAGSAVALSCCAAVLIDHTEIARNTGGSSAVAIWESSGLSFVSNDVHDNDGAALVVQIVSSGDGTLHDVLLSRFAHNGSGVSSDLELNFAGNLVVGNGGPGFGAGHANEVTVTNSTIADNAGVGLGGGVFAWNTIVFGNATDLDGTLAGGGNNLIGVSPGFVGGGDYHLAPGSPAIDRGDNAAATGAGLTVDADGDPRIINGGSGSAVVDIGWDEAVSGGSPDAGSGSDAGPADAGPGDAGQGDAGPADAGANDAGPGDAGGSVSDAGSPSDAGAVSDAGNAPDAGLPGGGGSGCSCRTASPGNALVWLVTVAFLFSSRRRRVRLPR